MKFMNILFIFLIITCFSYSIPAVSRNSGVCIAIEEFILETSKSPDSVEYLEASSIMEFENGLFAQRVKFLDSSDPNHPKVFNFIFLMDGNYNKAKVVTVGKPDEFINSVVNNSFTIRTLYNKDGTIIYD